MCNLTVDQKKKEKTACSVGLKRWTISFCNPFFIKGEMDDTSKKIYNVNIIGMSRRIK
jgi:hypothetical protein